MGRWTRRALALALGCAAAAALVEASFRAFGPRAPDPLTEAALAPFDVPFERERNSFGFHDCEWTIEKPADTWRLLVLGDSFCEGRRVPRDELFLELLERALQDRARRAPGAPRSVEVLNVSGSGWDTPMELDQLELALERGVAPDAVLLVFFVNDATSLDANPELVFDVLDGLHRRDAWASGLSAAWDWFDWQRRRARAERTLLADYERSFFGSAAETEHWSASREGFARLAALARERGFRAGVVLFPMLIDVDEQLAGAHVLARIYGEVERAAAELGLPVTSLLPAFAGREARDLWISPIDAHPNPLANALVAPLLESFVLEAGLVELAGAGG
jgi:hypothetical protein